MTVLECDVAGSRAESAHAAGVQARLLVLTEEIDRMGMEDCRLAEVCGLDAKDLESFRYPGLEKILSIFQPGMIPGYGTTWGKSATVVSLDQILAVSLVQREANLRTQADALEEWNELSAHRRTALESVAVHRKLMTQWTSGISRWDPGLASDMIRLESEERALLQRQMRLETAEAATRDAERALNRLWDALHDAVDWIQPEGASGQPPTPLLRSERLKFAEPLIFEIQVLLARARRALCRTDDLSRSDYNEGLSRFAGWCIESMGCDVAERDGTSRSCRTVSWTKTTVLGLRGYLTRSLVEIGQALSQLHLRRTKMLSRTRG